jgi:hypothetical protein
MNTTDTRSLSGWFNYKTKEYDYRETPTDFSDYIPQEFAAQDLYRMYQEQGMQPIEAAMKIWAIAAGVDKKG